MKNPKFREFTVILSLVVLLSFVVVGFISGKEACTEEQVTFCVEEVVGNLESCLDDTCTCDLLRWFSTQCMGASSGCDPEKTARVFEERGWDKLGEITCK